jgi:hypothetical protein
MPPAAVGSVGRTGNKCRRFGRGERPRGSRAGRLHSALTALQTNCGAGPNPGTFRARRARPKRQPLPASRSCRGAASVGCRAWSKSANDAGPNCRPGQPQQLVRRSGLAGASLPPLYQPRSLTGPGNQHSQGKRTSSMCRWTDIQTSSQEKEPRKGAVQLFGPGKR